MLKTNDAILITETELINEPKPKIVFMNEAFCKITGYGNEELMFISPRMLQFEDTDRNELKRFKNKIQKWEHAEITIINKMKTDEKFHYLYI